MKYNIPGRPETFKDHGALPEARTARMQDAWDAERALRNSYPTNKQLDDATDEADAQELADRQADEQSEAMRLGQSWGPV